MQTTKSRPGSLDVTPKPSPATPRTARKLKTSGSDPDLFSSPKSKTPKDKSPKVVGRSPRSPAIEKKRAPSRVSELEPQLAQLQDELKRAKEQLSSSESWKRKAQQEAEEAKKQLAAMSAKLEETQNQLKELSDSEEARLQELRKVSQDRDRVWQSELEAVQKQHSMDSAALASALNEIQKLKLQLDRVTESQTSHARHADSAHAEIQSLRIELTETLELVENLKNQLNDSRESEAQAMEEVGKAQMLLEVVKTTEEALRLEHDNVRESYSSLLAELDQSKNKANTLEELASKLRADLAKSESDAKSLCENGDKHEQAEMLEHEVDSLKRESAELRDALEAAEKRYQDQYLQSTLQIRDAYELVKHSKSESLKKESELAERLRESQVEIEELKEKLMEKEQALQSVPLDNNNLLNLDVKEKNVGIELNNSESGLEDLKASLSEMETQLQSITEENKMLKSEILKREVEKNKANDEALASTEAARAAEQEALMKLGHLTEEADKSCRRTTRVTEELDAAQAANSEMEAELRRLKVQSDQWRKAAEAAAAMLSNGNNNGKYVERTGSLDYHTIGGKLGLPYSEDTDDESPKKKNGNMLKKIGVLLKKGQK
ncbi:interactor of constitutive active ROPs 2, chloroplastic [Salvia hispanica]|uniref:interactor of constitutive active ROPs 2, chloroplastic n=1 Tax=Salvia hispanica TaxID=49212 RepID=UPI0020090B05|nr:interactor of constitutive active ROPs 2, chloroplastic [Salvia hispanica]XP_047956684.1 interactor of constitutive active ROPs 2, chloroplastic [Salvia hispanica]XP_047956685.1 interactor of constitutive active ROPs 2, chloroplastic [Salvia hispanica]XP_047956686.1 interactor of constitutive active ROPs 2, chloroplastic [Salvia hispanica]